jgi:hypothetical protein
MTAKKGPIGIMPGQYFTLPSGATVKVVEWLDMTGGWHCHYVETTVARPTINDQLSWVYLRHEFLLRHGVRT